jgi:hypothetical protein
MTVNVTEVPDRFRYEARLDGRPAGILQYVYRDGQVVLVHTEVDEAFEGNGVGGALARYALDAARGSGRTVRVVCPFVAEWVRRHPDYLDAVDPEERDRITVER